MKINLFRTVFLSALFVSIISPSIAGAASTWTQVTNDSFGRANSSTVGNSWDDESNTGSISTSTLVVTAPASNNTGYPRILRPSSEISLDQKVDATFTLSAGDIANGAIERRLILRAHKEQAADGSNLYSSYQARLSNGGTFQIVRMYNGLQLTPNAAGNGSFTATAGHSYLASFSVTNTFPSVLLLTLIDMTASTTQVIASTSLSDYAYVQAANSSNGLNKTTTFMQPGVAGVGIAGASAGQSVTYTNVTTYSNSQSGSMVVPTIIGNNLGGYYAENRKFYLTTQYPTGGTASSTSITNPYYIRWYRGSGNFTPPTTRDGSGGGSGTFVGTGNEVVDSNAPTGVSNYSISYKAVFFDYGTASTTGVAGGYTNVNSPSALIAKNIQYIGDSITYGLYTSTNSNSTAPSAFAGTILNADSAINTVYSLSAITYGVSSMTTNDFAGTLLSAVRSMAYDGQIGVASIMLGANDAKDSGTTSLAQYKANIQTIMNAVTNAATTTSPKFVLNKTTWIAPGALGLWSTSTASVLQGYFGQLDQLANGTNIVVGSTSAYTETERFGYASGHTHIGSASYPSPGPVLGTSDYLVDGVHPYDGGTKMIATLEWAPNVKNALLGNYTAAYDATAPNATVTAPLAASTMAGSSVTLSATSTDNTGVSGVKFYVDSTLIGSEDTSSPYSVTWDSTVFASGTHSVVAVARDAAGNVATSSAVSFTVDNTAPVRSAGSPSGTLALNTTSTTISLTTNETATCKYSTSSGQSYGSMTSFSTTGGTSHSQSISGLTNAGSYIYYVKCSDTNSNINATDYTISFAVAADTTSPVATLTSPANNSVISGSSVSVAATATDDVSVSGVKFYIDTTLIGSEDTSFPYSVTLNSTSVIDGSHSIRAVARDGTGNVATSSVFTVTVDNTAPVISSISASNVTTSSSDITWTTDELANSQVYYGTSISYGSTGSSSSMLTSHSQSISGLSASTLYHYIVVSADALGNQATSSDQTFTTSAVVTGPTFAPGSQTGGGSASAADMMVFRNIVAINNQNNITAPVVVPLPAKFTATANTGTQSLQVKQLQYFLNTHGFPVSNSGVGSLGKETTYFGEQTKLAVKKFQKANGITPVNGLFGPKTMAAVNAVLKKGK